MAVLGMKTFNGGEKLQKFLRFNFSIKYEERKTTIPGQLDRKTTQIGLLGDFFPAIKKKIK